MTDYPPPEQQVRVRISDATFDKSRSNRRTEKHGVTVVTRDPRFQWVAPGVRRAILNRLGVPQTFSDRVFDVVMTERPRPSLTLESLDDVMDELRLIEIKVTQKVIHDEALGGYFFGATKNEFDVAELLGEKYLFALVVLGAANKYGDDFFVLLTLPELESRIKSKRLQYQVTLERGLTYERTKYGVGPVVEEREQSGPA